MDPLRPLNESCQMWMNIVTALMAAIPMLLPSIKPMLPEHYYGVLSSVVLVINAAIDIYRRSQYTKVGV